MFAETVMPSPRSLILLLEQSIPLTLPMVGSVGQDAQSQEFFKHRFCCFAVSGSGHRRPASHHRPHHATNKVRAIVNDSFNFILVIITSWKHCELQQRLKQEYFGQVRSQIDLRTVFH